MVAGMVIFAIGVLPYAVIFGIEWTFDKCMPNRKTMTGPTTTISEDTDNNRSRRREEYSYNQSNAQSLYDAARREERIQNRADMCEDGRCGHPWHQK